MNEANNLPIELRKSSKFVAIVDDEPDILELVIINLQKAGFKTRGFEDGNSFLDFLKEKLPDLVILDLMLPDIDGVDICKFMKKDKKYSGIPIIMLTAKTDETDRVLGLELGADDYITKPFSPRELAARVKAVLRRGESSEQSHQISFGDILLIDIEKHEVYVERQKINLTATEFKILHLLTSRKGWVFSREQILNYLDENNKAVLDRTVDVHIKNLREKLGIAGSLIKNIRGIGYKIEELITTD